MTKASAQDQPPTRRSSRERLLTAATALIAEGGWAAVTTRAAADRAGVNQGLVHYYFGSVSALCREALTEAVTAMMDPSVDALVSEGLAAGLREAATGVEALAADGAETLLLLEATLQSVRDPEMAEVFRSLLEQYRDRIGASASPGSSPDLALALGAMIDGLMLYRLLDPDLDITAAVEAVIERLSLGDPGPATNHSDHPNQPGRPQ